MEEYGERDELEMEIVDCKPLPSEEMTTWSQLRRYVSSQHELALDETDLLAYTITLSSGRTQRVLIRRFTILGHEFVELRTLVCRYCEIPADEALEHNSSLELGAFALADGVYFLQHKVSLESLELSNFADIVNTIACRGDMFEERYTDRDVY